MWLQFILLEISMSTLSVPSVDMVVKHLNLKNPWRIRNANLVTQLTATLQQYL